MERDRIDAILDRLEGLLDEIDEPEQRKELREIQQLVIGVRENCAPDEEG
ncbi:hypothetical protein HWV07_13085 [Natronomonas salina]|nr:hypothetical protein [Natronomonas salina]QLD89911.1 hypothetical protein HWV07_13085 [Natronomonas salina]